MEHRARSDGELYISLEGQCVDMATAVIWFRTAEGFAIGSDGRVMDGDTNAVITDEAQKIFCVKQARIWLAYGLAGTVRVGDEAGIIYDFEPEAAQAFELMRSDNRRRNWYEYLLAVSATMRDGLNRVRRGPIKNATQTWIFVGGFYENLMKSAHLLFTHGPAATEVDVHTHPPNFTFGPFGSGQIFELVDSDDPRFIQYSQPKRKAVSNLATAIERIEKDIRAHCDPAALAVDEITCRGIGGRVQIATVTAEGFRWVRGFEAASI